MWIKCSDRLPSESGKYIILAPSADPDKPLITIAWFEPSVVFGWSLLTPHWIIATTHWMPLPTPPTPHNLWKSQAQNKETKCKKKN
jgi:hypothetical protein